MDGISFMYLEPALTFPLNDLRTPHVLDMSIHPGMMIFVSRLYKAS